MQPSVVSGLELWQWREDARKRAVSADVPPAEVDWLLQAVAGLDPLALRLESFKNRPQIELQLSLPQLTQLWQQRLHQRLPVQYLAGVTPWRHFSLTVSPAVLIPRPETEELIDLAVAATRDELEPSQVGELASLPNSEFSNLSIWQPVNRQLDKGHWADLGTGSGAIALGLAEVFPAATVHAVDASPDALAIAQLNAQQLGFADRIQFYQGSWWEPLEALKGQLSGMVSNPPYIPTDLIPQLQPEVVEHEPHTALDGGTDGLDCIRQLVDTSPTYLRPGGIWLIEMMAGQADAVVQLLQNQGSYHKIQIFPDLAGIDRFALAYIKDG